MNTLITVYLRVEDIECHVTQVGQQVYVALTSPTPAVFAE